MRKLKSVTVGEDLTEVVWNVSHDNGVTTVEQDLHLIRTRAGWTAGMLMSGSAPQRTPAEAGHKRPIWFARLSEEMEKPTYNTVDLRNL